METTKDKANKGSSNITTINFCPSCGVKQAEGSKFCHSCGNSLIGEAESKKKLDPKEIAELRAKFRVDPNHNSSGGEWKQTNVQKLLWGGLGVVLISLISLYGGGDISNNSKSVATVPSKLLQPYKYIGESSGGVGEIFSIKPNSVGNVIYDDSNYHVVFEATDNVIGFVDVNFLETKPCKQTGGVYATPLLQALGIDYNSRNIEVVKKRPHSSTYYDHANKLKILAMCPYDGAPLSVSFSRKYYMN